MPDLFLSYSRDDSLMMGVIRDNLRKLGFNVWVDIEHLTPGTPQWVRAVKHAVGSTDAMLVLCSPAAEKSIWVNREVYMARVADKPIVPILIAGEEWDAIPADLMGDQYLDMRGRSMPEYGFRELVTWLAEGFDSDIPDYELHASDIMQIPTVQIITIHEHHEGHVINIGGDVEGQVNVAGGDIHHYAPLPPSAAQPEHDAPQPRTRPARLNESRAIVIGAVITGLLGLLGTVIATGGFGLIGSGSAHPPATATPTQRIVAEEMEEPPADEPTSLPTSSPTRAPTDAPEPTALPGFEPVTRNADWEPVIEEKNGVQMALVPVGCFQMGSEDGGSDESPVHEVCFDEPFWIDVYEVTNEQYGEAASGCTDRSSDDNQPRICISWTDSLAHCEARGARLPTEAEWEYAARGPDGLVYPWGDEFSANNVIYDDNSEGHTWATGSKPGGASWVGVFDLSGNVWEWVNDWYDSEYYETLADGVINPQGPGTGDYRVLRGGSWVDYSGLVRAANRGWPDPSDENIDDGSRCALSYQSTLASIDIPPPTDTPMPSPMPTLTAGQHARQLAEAGVTRNADWTPYIEEFNSVEMALVPAGCFIMGSEDGDNDEQPVHEVCFDRPFWIDVYEVTNAQFADFGGVAGHISNWIEGERPRERITWTESAVFCELRGARLPTEAEWEYAARGPDALMYPWGNDFVVNNVVYHGNSNNGTWIVGSKSGGASWIGAYDLIGNVWEWVSDWSGRYEFGRQMNPQGPDTGDKRVLRGSSWSSLDIPDLRAAIRRSYYPSVQGDNIGFRCARSYTP